MTTDIDPTSSSLKSDLAASVVVFLVALPLCLGIALASGAPLLSGLIAGIVGGVIVGALSGSPLGVSGPAAGLAVIVLHAIQELGHFEQFLVAVMLAGVMQMALGLARAGSIAYYFPSAVITGMLSGIGVIIILKQIPHAFGYDRDFEGDEAFLQADGHNSLSELLYAFEAISPGPMIIAAVALVILIVWETAALKKVPGLSRVPGPLVAVVVGALLNVAFQGVPALALKATQTVGIPVIDGLSAASSLLTFPDFSAFADARVYRIAVVLAVVASLETLLCVEATDKLDPLKRVTPTNRELLAQGAGNVAAGLLGGLPVTQVIVRSSANIQSGGRTKVSAIAHGVLLALSVLLLASVMNTIPLSALAAVLLMVGYKLSKPSLYKQMYGRGMGQFVPFMATIVAIVFTDLLTGIAVGLAVAVVVILLENYQLPFQIRTVRAIDGASDPDGDQIQIILAQQVTFLNKVSVLRCLSTIPDGSNVEVNAMASVFVHPDVIEVIDNFTVSAKTRRIRATVVGLDRHRNNAVSLARLARESVNPPSFDQIEKHRE